MLAESFRLELSYCMVLFVMSAPPLHRPFGA
jgi:hypothetical protein